MFGLVEGEGFAGTICQRVHWKVSGRGHTKSRRLLEVVSSH